MEQRGRFHTKVDPRLHLIRYWISADLMRAHLLDLMDQYDGDLRALQKDNMDWEFITYQGYWFAALFVVVEGWHKLKLKDARVQKLMLPHMQDLKRMRHMMYHFMPHEASQGHAVVRHWNWAEELHAALGEVFSEYANSELLAEHEEKRQKRNAAARASRAKKKAASQAS